MSRTNVVGLIYMTDMMCREVTTHAKKKKKHLLVATIVVSKIPTV